MHPGRRNAVLSKNSCCPTVPIWKYGHQCRDGTIQDRDIPKIQITRGIEILCLLISTTVPQSQFGSEIRNVATDGRRSRHWRSAMHTGHRNPVLTNISNCPTVLVWMSDQQCRNGTIQDRDIPKVQITRGIEILCLLISPTVPQSQFGSGIRNVATDGRVATLEKCNAHGA